MFSVVRLICGTVHIICFLGKMGLGSSKEICVRVEETLAVKLSSVVITQLFEKQPSKEKRMI